MVIWLVFGISVAVSDADDILDRWERRVAKIESFVCEFQQEKKISFMKRPLVSRGEIFYRQRRLLWRTDTPSRSYLALDEQSLRIFDPEFNTVEIYALNGTTERGSLPGLTLDPRKMREQYRAAVIADFPVGEGKVGLRLTPVDATVAQNVESIDIGLNSEFLVQSWRIRETDGDELFLTVSEFDENVEVSDEQLRLEVPDDAKVIRHGEQ